ncbi:MAG: hypothetical protein ACM3JD_17705 [Rudaea sp.]
MPVFKDSKQFYQTVGELMDRAKKDPKIGPAIAKSRLIIRFVYHDPEAETTVNARDKPSQPGAYADVFHGPCTLKPDVTMTMKADVSHAFWHGKVNLTAALARKQIVAQGPILKIIQLLPAVAPLYKMYPALLKEKGLTDMVMK